MASAVFASEYRFVRLPADAPGVVHLRGDGIQGVDWPAAGRGSAVVPVVFYQSGPPMTLNGRPWTPVFVDSVETAGPVAFDDEAYQQAELWRPGRSEAARQWLLGAAAVAVLTLGVARHADPKRATRWLLLAALGLSTAAVAFFPSDQPQVTRPATGRPGREWLFVAGRPGDRVDVPADRGLFFQPRSAGHLKPADPVLRCDATGKPVAITCRIGEDGRAVFVRLKPS